MMQSVNRRTTSAALILTGILLLSLNLRPAAVSVGPVLREIRGALDMSGVSVGLLTSLPVIAFAIFGAMAPWAARRLGVHRVTLLALFAVAVGLFSRALADSGPVLLALSALALAGMAMANVLLPSLVKLHFPGRIGTVTALYTTVLAVGLTLALTLTVPISESFGGWRTGLGVWGALALLAAVPWLGLVRQDRRVGESHAGLRFSAVLRTPLGLAMAVFFGLQSMQAYIIFNWFASVWRDSGFTATEAGMLVGLLAGTSIPLSLFLPAAVHWVADPRPIVLGTLACYPVGYAFLLSAPHSMAIPAAIIIGAGTTTFPISLVLIGMRARTPAGTATLSSVTQAVGYTIAGVGPFGFGLLHDATGGWNIPLGCTLALVLPMALLSLYLGQRHYIEDQLPDATPGEPPSSAETRTRS